MDMFFAACEERENPELSGKLFAVGGNSMLSTSNYEARKYGIRAAMPGFIGKVLARRLAKKELIIIPVNYRLYSSISAEVQTVFAQYDANFSMMSLDEAYLDFTHHMSLRPDMSRFQKSVVEKYCPECFEKREKLKENQKIIKETEQICEDLEASLKNQLEENDKKLLADEIIAKLSGQPFKPNFDSSIEVRDVRKLSDEKLKRVREETLKIQNDFTQRSCPNCSRKYFKDDIDGAVEEMRYKVFKVTRLTCSGTVSKLFMLIALI